MQAEIIAIGSELLTPFRTDTNSLFLTDQLNRIGVEVAYKTLVGDHRQRLADSIAVAWRRSGLVITIGGLGPTEDDLTRECAAEALGRTLISEPELAAGIEARFRARGLHMADINLRQAMRISGAEILPNPRGTAPGQWIEADGKILILLPGPPRELEPMFEQACVPRLRQMLPASAICRRALRLTGLNESAAEEIVAPIYSRYTNPATTILATPGEVQLHLTSTSSELCEAKAAMEELFQKLELALGDHVFSTDGASLEEVVGRELTARHATLVAAESCTGGLLAERITKVAGSSNYFLGGIVSYSNDWKMGWLGVNRATLDLHGAVSSEVARELAEAVRERGRADYSLSITGIAGPGGATPNKPVGLVYIGLAGPQGTHVQEKHYFGEREMIRWQAAQTALDLLRRALQSKGRAT